MRGPKGDGAFETLDGFIVAVMKNQRPAESGMREREFVIQFDRTLRALDLPVVPLLSTYGNLPPAGTHALLTLAPAEPAAAPLLVGAGARLGGALGVQALQFDVVSEGFGQHSA